MARNGAGTDTSRRPCAAARRRSRFRHAAVETGTGGTSLTWRAEARSDGAPGFVPPPTLQTKGRLHTACRRDARLSAGPAMLPGRASFTERSMVQSAREIQRRGPTLANGDPRSPGAHRPPPLPAEPMGGTPPPPWSSSRAAACASGLCGNVGRSSQSFHVGDDSNWLLVARTKPAHIKHCIERIRTRDDPHR